MKRRNRRNSRLLRGIAQKSELRMTSMMDILTVLLLFLLKSFVVGGEAINPPPGIELPNSSAESQPEISLIIAIDDESIFLGGERVATIRETVESDDLIIEGLDAKLQSVIEQRDDLASRRGQTEFEDEIVTIQGDRRIEFRVLRKVMYTLNYNGFDNIALAVIKTS